MKREILIGLLTSLILFGCAQKQPPQTIQAPPPPVQEQILQNITQAPERPVTSGQMEADFIDVGQGDATLFKKGDYEVLIDCGDNAYGGRVISYLKSKGVQEIELLVVSHPHSDHLGGCDDVLKNFKVLEVWDNGRSQDTQTYRDYIALATQTNHTTATVGMRKDLEGIVLTVLQSDMGSSNVNDNSVVTKISYGSINFLMTGDCEADCENSITANVSSEVLKIGHHGSRTATSQTFLNRVSPQVAVISVGANNRYGHPHPETLSKLISILLYRTDLNGNVVITTNGTNYSVSTDRTATR